MSSNSGASQACLACGVWQWQEQHQFGPSAAGSGGVRPMWTRLPGSCFGAGFTRMRTDRLTFAAGSPAEFTLTVSVRRPRAHSARSHFLYYPCSGQTPPSGVTSRLVDLGLTRSPAASPRSVRRRPRAGSP